MILSQPEIRKALADGHIGFDPPLEAKQWGHAGVDLRLGFRFTKLRDIGNIKVPVAEGLKEISRLRPWDSKELKEFDELGKRETYTIDPGEFVLSMTYETVKIPKNMIALIEGRSTYARVGLSMHQTAPWIQPGFDGPIILEIMNNGPFHIELTPKDDRPCQLTFFQLTSELSEDLAYGAQPDDVYQHQRQPFPQQKDR